MQIKKNVQALKPYVAGKPTDNRDFVKLNANECPFDIPRSVYKKTSRIRNVNRYHEGSGFKLREKIARFMGLNQDNVILGNGSGELIKTFLETFCEKDTSVIIPEGTFTLYSLYSLIHYNNPVRVPLNEDYSVNLEEIVQKTNQDTSVIFISNPNNPTGQAYSYEKLEDFFSKIPSDTGIFLDEAYIHYSSFYDEAKVKELIDKFPNLFVLRTFSKIGLAGVRMGYGMGNREMIQAMHRVRPPFNTSIYAQKMAEALLDEVKYLDKIRDNNTSQRTILKEEIASLGLKVYPSHGNFLLISGKENLDKILEEKKILIRSTQSFGLPSDYYRITIGTPEENRVLIKRLKEVL
jgi:histidinol-phosphate aminotransferase